MFRTTKATNNDWSCINLWLLSFEILFKIWWDQTINVQRCFCLFSKISKIESWVTKPFFICLLNTTNFHYHLISSLCRLALSDLGGGAGPSADPGGGARPIRETPRFLGPKIEHFWALFNFPYFFCLTSLGILFL